LFFIPLYFQIKRFFVNLFSKYRDKNAKDEISKYNKSKKEETIAFKEVGLSEYLTSNYEINFR